MRPGKLRLPGAGGCGDPSKRDRKLVGQDLRDGKISRESAVRDYGCLSMPDPA